MSKDRISVEIENVGTDWVTIEVQTPQIYQIIRVVARTTGTATQVALRLREKDQDTHTRLEYGLTSGEIDSIEEQDNIIIFTKERVSERNVGTTYIAAKCDTTLNTVNVEIDIETLK